MAIDVQQQLSHNCNPPQLATVPSVHPTSSSCFTHLFLTSSPPD
ncbi:hypothetical protein COLO4_37400 [Corchorus olitorius]|uniref:Uncharacterized protein n=1 Tax=Corchorus olitorius TaxID=93759 RepID=A0A1R3G223_9ROSI|nr:hypothetical protein COLO4_37400 [Corchorus olitorius]